MPLALRAHALGLASLLALLGCGGGSEEVETTDETTTSETSGSETVTTAEPEPEVDSIGIRPRSDDEIPRAPQPWAEMTPEQKGQFMGAEVMPYMRDLFREYDAERYASFNCATCHGQNATERNFEMPNPDILPLHPSGTPEQRAMVEAHPRMVRFMFNHVVPAMREMIGAEEYDAETGEGFSCYFCHPHAEEGETASSATASLARAESVIGPL